MAPVAAERWAITHNAFTDIAFGLNAFEQAVLRQLEPAPPEEQSDRLDGLLVSLHSIRAIKTKVESIESELEVACVRAMNSDSETTAHAEAARTRTGRWADWDDRRAAQQWLEVRLGPLYDAKQASRVVLELLQGARFSWRSSALYGHGIEVGDLARREYGRRRVEVRLRRSSTHDSQSGQT